MQTNPTQKIIDRIKTDKVVPATRFYLRWKNNFFWILWGGMMLLGALFFSLIILDIFAVGPVFFSRFLQLRKLLFLVIMSAPYLWVLLAALALVLGLMVLRRTKRGYRLNLLFMTTIGVLIISVIGIGLHFFRINERFEHRLSHRIPHHRGPFFPMENGWGMPDEGLIGGEIQDVQPQYFRLEAFRGGAWKVYYNEDTELRMHGVFKTGLRVGVAGEKISETEFQARVVRELRPRLDGALDGERPLNPPPPPPLSDL